MCVNDSITRRGPDQRRPGAFLASMAAFQATPLSWLPSFRIKVYSLHCECGGSVVFIQKYNVNCLLILVVKARTTLPEYVKIKPAPIRSCALYRSRLSM